MNDIVLDSSVLLAIFKGEDCEQDVLRVIEGAVMSSVNLTEVLTRLLDADISADKREIKAIFALLKRIEPFTEEQARVAASLRDETKHAGLSLGDRACLALALELDAVVYTADRAWSLVDVACRIHLVR